MGCGSSVARSEDTGSQQTAAGTSPAAPPAPAASSASKMAIPLETLAKQDSATSTAILEAYKQDEGFKKLSERLTKEIMQRDAEDGDKLAKGIQLAVDKGVLPANVEVEPTTKVDVTGKTAEAVADEIIAALGDAPSKGCVMTLQGLSGTGKGTTVAKLKEKLPKSVTWSNGNVFRSLTLLAVKHSEKEGCELKDALKPEVLAGFCKMLDFDQYNGKFDVKIEGLDMKYYVSEVQNTVLKDSSVAKNIPTVAEVTQGEVVNFVQGALQKMAAAGSNVLVEGREQTLNHIRTPHRFELVLQDNNLIGMRQAALQVGAKAYEQLKGVDSPGDDAIEKAIKEAVSALAA
mmetsp:Transcript_31935/g.74769  ORF Transcript_31935/g.74769 Transcript_31935/m.74769 type:complete len:346 (-) Transcript_31935:200-1237(-)